MKRHFWLIVGALLVIGFIAGLVWHIVEIKKCRDAGGIVVAPLMRDQQCYTPKAANDVATTPDIT